MGVRLYPIRYKKCLKCQNRFKSRRRANRHGKIYRSMFCSQKCSHGFQILQNHWNWKKGLWRKNGYLFSSKTKNYLHRELFEKHIGRKLNKSEVIHHKNHNKNDNRVENLELMTASAHAKHHRMHLCKK